jgi:NTP pyrophosphatase (non-canonical NTP hydrolase)
MTLFEQVTKIEILRKELWPERTTATTDSMNGLFAQMLEEAGELRQACRDLIGRKYKQTTGSIEHIAEEAGDLLSMVIAVIAVFDIPMEKALAIAIDKYEKIKKDLND